MADITRTAKKVAAVFAPKCKIAPKLVGTGGVDAGNPVYVDTSLGRVIKASAGAAGTRQYAGTALATKSEGEVVDVLEDGWLGGLDLSGLAFGALAYLSNTAGEFATAAGTTSVPVGRVVPLSDRDPSTNKPSKVLRVFSPGTTNF